MRLNSYEIGLGNMKIGKLAAAAAGAVLTAPSAMAEYALNMTPGVTELSREVYDLHMVILWICVVIGIGVFGAMIVSMVLHRKSRGVEPAQFSHSTRAETIWTIIPVLILIGMALPATRVLIQMEDTGDADMTVKITGYQWMWRYEYIEDDVSFLSRLTSESNVARQLNSGIDVATVDNYLLDVDRPVVLPTDTKIRFLITADDVIHSWWIPDLGWKRDAIPGFVNEAWTRIDEPGTYRGQCAELCGKDHGFMPIVVIAKTPEDYQQWVAEQKAEQVAVAKANDRTWTRPELMAHGETVYQQQCAACHMEDGSGLAPAFPALNGSDVANGPVSSHIDIVLNGRSDTPMQGFGDLLSAADIAAAITYTRNAWGNEAGDVVQPATIQQTKRG